MDDNEESEETKGTWEEEEKRSASEVERLMQMLNNNANYNYGAQCYFNTGEMLRVYPNNAVTDYKRRI